MAIGTYTHLLEEFSFNTFLPECLYCVFPTTTRQKLSQDKESQTKRIEKSEYATTTKMADPSTSNKSSLQPQNAASRSKRDTDDLDARQTPTKPLAGWQLREQMKAQHRGPPPGAVVRKPISRSSLDGEVDPNLPPAFRAAFAARQRKKGIDDFNSMASVHTTSSTMKTENTVNASDSDDDDHDSDSLDGHGSFASLGEDESDDEAYREGRNQMARQAVESSRLSNSPSKTIKSVDHLRFKKAAGVHKTPLDFIAE